jgi:hypothetical protein
MGSPTVVPIDFCRSSDSADVENPGNILFVAGLRAQTTEEKLEKHFSTEGKVMFTSKEGKIIIVFYFEQRDF